MMALTGMIFKVTGNPDAYKSVTYGASIHYTTNGNLPTEADPVVVSGLSLNIQVSTILRARAFMIATPPSDHSSALYLIGVQPGGNGPVITITYPTVGIRQL